MTVKVKIQNGLPQILEFSYAISAHQYIETMEFIFPLLGTFCYHHVDYRSLKMDRWKPKEVKQMELGGNKNAVIFFEKNGMFVDGKPNHKAA